MLPFPCSTQIMFIRFHFTRKFAGGKEEILWKSRECSRVVTDRTPAGGAGGGGGAPGGAWGASAKPCSVSAHLYGIYAESAKVCPEVSFAPKGGKARKSHAL